MAKKTAFTRESAQRIAQAVRKVEGTQRQNRPSRTWTSGDSFGRVIVGKTAGSHAKSAAGTINIWDGETQGSETDTGETLSAWNYFAAISAGKWVAVVETVRGYIIISAEC